MEYWADAKNKFTNFSNEVVFYHLAHHSNIPLFQLSKEGGRFTFT
jgi:hypothetical protein